MPLSRQFVSFERVTCITPVSGIFAARIFSALEADADGNGIGDLKGITAKVPYLKKLGVDAVWLSPFYPSALADGGYDVDDFRDVDPKIGTLADFDEMASALHAAGLKLIVDVVPNHTSNLHVWFQEALASAPGSAARDRYIFRDGLGEKGELPPLLTGLPFSAAPPSALDRQHRTCPSQPGSPTTL